MAIWRRYQIGQKSTSLATGDQVFRDGQWWDRAVWQEEEDRRKAKSTIPHFYAEFKRLVGSIRSS